MVTKINPVYDITLPRSFNGKTVQVVTVTFAATVAASTAPEGVLDKVIKTLSLRATPIMISDVAGGTVMSVFYEGEFPTDDYNGDNTPTTFAAQLEADIQALGTVDSIDISGATVAAGAVYQADQTNT
jgi:hypothetical protein